MSRIVTVGAAQLGPIAPDESRASTVKRMMELLREAKGKGCDLVVFPEMALTTFFPRYYKEDRKKMDHYFERDMPGSETQPLFDAAKEAGIAFYLGYCELTPDGHHYNTSILVDDGKIVGKYRKVHLPGHAEFDAKRPWQHLEKRYFEPGDLGWPVWRVKNGIMGMGICNDRRWPETCRVMSLKGVELVMFGYNTPDRNTAALEPNHLRMFHNHLCMQSDAYRNSCFIVGVAKAGVEDGCMLIGGSCIIQPSGEIIGLASTLDDELIVSSCDLDLAKMGKETVFNYAKHRRIEHYGIISNQTGVEIPEGI